MIPELGYFISFFSKYLIGIVIAYIFVLYLLFNFNYVIMSYKKDKFEKVKKIHTPVAPPTDDKTYSTGNIWKDQANKTLYPEMKKHYEELARKDKYRS